ncbi:MAG: hypothetical protein ACR2PK_11225 [Acidimicrobiales bacterium]
MPAPRRFMHRVARLAIVISFLLASIAIVRDRLIAANHAKHGPHPLPSDDPGPV